MLHLDVAIAPSEYKHQLGLFSIYNAPCMTERISQLILVILLCASLASAQNSDNPHPAGCEQYKNISIPAADLPSAGDRKQLASCVPEDLYFGFEKPADPVRARKCA